MKINWNLKKEFPDELNPAQNSFSVDVLVYFPKLDEHTIGWFDFNSMCWLFLSNQDYSDYNFKWRYFVSEVDKTNFKNDKK